MRVGGRDRGTYNFSTRVFVARVAEPPTNFTADDAGRCIVTVTVEDARDATHTMLISGTIAQVRYSTTWP